MIKQPGESPLTFSYEFADMLAGATIVTDNPATVVARGSGALLTRTAQGKVGTEVLVKWSGGVDGESYLTTVSIIDSNGDVHQMEGVIDCVDVGWVVPVGVSSAMITAEQYVDRFGKVETIRITDETNTGVIGAAKLNKALNDATEFVAGYVGVKYTLPFAAGGVPLILQGIVADLARERLFPNNPPSAVTDAADRARSQLKDIARGLMVLPIAEGQTPPTAGGFGSATSGDAPCPTFTPCNLAGFTDLGGGWTDGYC